jgi:glucose/arabinose dehydrogenase
MIRKTGIAFLLAAVSSVTICRAALTWDGCPALASGEFRAVDVATRTKDDVNEPMKMAFDLLAAPGEEAAGKVDVYFTERLGRVRKYDSKSGSVLTLATLPLAGVNLSTTSDGLMGIALDPAFKTNHFIYVYYTFISSSEKTWRVSRFALNAAHSAIDLASEIPVLKIPINTGSLHTGGALQFDAYGDLWITTGNDYKTGNDYPLYSSPNTNDLRGKILRIHPTADGKYTVPADNLFKAGQANTRPEIYIMGNRNPYTLSLDPVRLWAMWGDVGPDNKNFNGDPMNSGGAEKTEEYDLAKAPGNYGYPFFAGDFMTRPGTDVNAPAMPAGYGWEGAQPGLTTLPKAVAPIYAYKRACAVSGPLYRYDGDLKSSVKFPPHFQRKWLVSDFNQDNQKITAFTLNADGTAITAQDQAFAAISLHAPLDMQFGPDGALYVNNYAGYRSRTTATGIIRIEYSGTCRPAEPKLEKPGNTPIARPAASPEGPRIEFLRGRGLAVAIAAQGRIDLEIRDIRGRPVASKTATGPGPISLDEVHATGVYFLSVRSAEGARSVRFFLD